MKLLVNLVIVYFCSQIITLFISGVPKKSSGYDLITGKILKELHFIEIKYLTHLFNAVLLKGFFPAQWKVAQIILILKPGKPPNELPSYRPISLVPIVPKVLKSYSLKGSS
jgi:hypothetical protein